MSLNIRLLFITFLAVCYIRAQEKEETPVLIKDKGSFSLSSYTPISFGKSFVNRGLNTQTGVQLGLNFYIAQKIIVGTDFRLFGAENIDQQLLGNYNTTSINSINFKAGYRQEINRFFESTYTASIGYVSYGSGSENTSERFSDSGTSYALTADLAYNFIPWLGIYISPEFRFDDLKIDAPDRLQDLFNNANYLTVSFGVRVTFRNKIYAWELEERRLEHEADERKDREAELRAAERRAKRKAEREKNENK